MSVSNRIEKVEEMQTSTDEHNSSKVLPFDQWNVELFYHVIYENMTTYDILHVIIVEAVKCLSNELQNPKKPNENKLSSI